MTDIETSDNTMPVGELGFPKSEHKKTTFHRRALENLN